MAARITQVVAEILRCVTATSNTPGFATTYFNFQPT